MYIIPAITTVISVLNLSFVQTTETRTETCFGIYDNVAKISPDTLQIIGEEGNDIEMTQLTPEENQIFGFDEFKRYPGDPTALFIITPDGINREQQYPLMNFLNEQQEFHGITQTMHNGHNQLDAVEIEYSMWLTAHETCKDTLLPALEEAEIFCQDFEGITKDLVKKWMQSTLDKAISLRQNIVWKDALQSDRSFLKTLRKLRKSKYELKFVFAVGDKTTVIHQAEIMKKSAMQKYDKSQYYTSLRLIEDLATELKTNKMSEDMQCLMSNGDSMNVDKIGYSRMTTFIKANTGRTVARQFKSWVSKAGTGVDRKFRATDLETELKEYKIRKRKEEAQESADAEQENEAYVDTMAENDERSETREEVDTDSSASDLPGSGIVNYNDLASNAERERKDEGKLKDTSSADWFTTGFAFWVGLAVITIFMSLFGVIL